MTMRDSDELEVRVAHAFAAISDEMDISDATMKGQPGIGRWYIHRGGRAVAVTFRQDATPSQIEMELRWAFGVLNQ